MFHEDSSRLKHHCMPAVIKGMMDIRKLCETWKVLKENFTYSRADRRKNFLYRGTIPFCLHIVPWRLISTFLYVGGFKISCGLLPTRFSSNFVLNSITVKKFEISDTFLIQMTYIIWKLAKTTYKTFKRLPGIFQFCFSYELLNACFQTSTQEFCEILTYFSHLKQQ
jgi:hypothetical protein